MDINEKIIEVRLYVKMRKCYHFYFELIID